MQPALAPDRIAILVGVIDLVQLGPRRLGQHGGVLGLAHSRRAVQQQVGADDAVRQRGPQQTDGGRRVLGEMREVRHGQGALGRALEKTGHQRLGIGVRREQDMRQILAHVQLVLQIGVPRRHLDQSRG